jgi:hypothetical protein
MTIKPVLHHPNKVINFDSRIFSDTHMLNLKGAVDWLDLD